MGQLGRMAIEDFDPYPRVIEILRLLATDPENLDALARECGTITEMFQQVDLDIARIENKDISIEQQETVITQLEDRIKKKRYDGPWIY